MRRLALPTIAGSLVFLFAVTALGQSVAAPGNGRAVAAVVASSPTTDHDTYVQRARDEVATWRGRLDATAADAKGTAMMAGGDADRDLHSAWVELQTAADGLQNVGADGWTAAQAAYRKASDAIASAWHRVHPEKT